MALTLLPDGPVQADDIVPDGLLQLTLGVDFPVPYPR
jgi:hypothetical protein